jgi:hypothetical protein
MRRRAFEPGANYAAAESGDSRPPALRVWLRMTGATAVSAGCCSELPERLGRGTPVEFKVSATRLMAVRR